MCDSGCNSLLLPLAEGDVLKLTTLFPAYGYTWSVNTGGGVAAVQSLTLRIDDSSGSIPVKLNGSQNETLVEFLRFHLVSNDLVDLLKVADEVKLSEENKKLLGDHLQELPNSLKATEKRRRHALLGQSIFCQFEYTLQARESLLILTKNFDFNTLKGTYSHQQS